MTFQSIPLHRSRPASLRPLPAVPRLAAMTLFAAAAWLAAPMAAHAGEGDSWLSRMGWNGVKGSGTLKTESRVVTGFQAVALRGSMNLVLRQGTREGIELRADDNILPLIETSVVDHGGVPTLEIGSKRGVSYSSQTPVVATIDLKTLTALTISGSGDVTCDSLKTAQLRIALSGSGNLRLQRLDTDALSSKVSGSGDQRFAGRATQAEFSVSGSGDIDAKALEADDVSVSVAGSGDASVTARKTLSVSIAGSGSVVYAGDPSLKTSVAGHGSIKKL